MCELNPITATRRAAMLRAAQLLGGQAALASAIGYPDRRNVAPWMAGDRPLSPIRCVAIEQATAGAVTRQDLRPDDWAAIWPELAAPATAGQGSANAA